MKNQTFLCYVRLYPERDYYRKCIEINLSEEDILVKDAVKDALEKHDLGFQMKVYRYQKKKGEKKLKKEDWKSPQVMVLNTFMMLGASYESSKLLTKIPNMKALKEMIKKKTLPYRIYDFRNKLPYYCMDITKKKMNEIEIYEFWDSPIGIYTLLINGVTLKKEFDNSDIVMPPTKKMKRIFQESQDGSSFTGEQLFRIQSRMSEELPTLCLAFGNNITGENIFKDMLPPDEFDDEYSRFNSCRTEDYKKGLSSTFIICDSQNESKIVGRCVSISPKHIITIFHVVSTVSTDGEYQINKNLIFRKEKVKIKLTNLKLIYPPLEESLFTDIAIFEFIEEIFDKNEYVQLFHKETSSIKQPIKLLKPNSNISTDTFEKLYLCHKGHQKLGDESSLRIYHHQDWWSAYPHPNKTKDGFCGSPGFTFYKGLNGPYLLLLHRFGLFKDEDEKEEGDTKFGGGIRIDLFLKREFRHLMSDPEDQEGRIESFQLCKCLVTYLLEQYGYDKIETPWFCPNFSRE
eukprot:gene12790-7062_t